MSENIPIEELIKKEIEDKELDSFQIDTFKLESDIPYDENNEPIEDIKVSPELFDNDEDYIPEDQGDLLRGIDNYSGADRSMVQV